MHVTLGLRRDVCWKAFGGLALQFRSKARRCLVRALDAVMCLRKEVASLQQGRAPLAPHGKTCLRAKHDLASLCSLPSCLAPLAPTQHNTTPTCRTTHRPMPFVSAAKLQLPALGTTQHTRLSPTFTPAPAHPAPHRIHTNLPCGRVRQHSHRANTSAPCCTHGQALPSWPNHACCNPTSPQPPRTPTCHAGASTSTAATHTPVPSACAAPSPCA